MQSRPKICFTAARAECRAHDLFECRMHAGGEGTTILQNMYANEIPRAIFHPASASRDMSGHFNVRGYHRVAKCKTLGMGGSASAIIQRYKTSNNT